MAVGDHILLARVWLTVAVALRGYVHLAGLWTLGAEFLQNSATVTCDTRCSVIQSLAKFRP